MEIIEIAIALVLCLISYWQGYKKGILDEFKANNYD